MTKKEAIKKITELFSTSAKEDVTVETGENGEKKF